VSRNGLLLLIILLAAVVAVLVWLGRGGEGAVASGPDAPLVAAFAGETLREIALDCNGTTVTLTRGTAQSWRVTRPFEAEADTRRVDELVASLRDARVRKVIEDKGGARDPYGLGSGACTVRLDLGPDRPAVALRVGRSSPVGTGRYAATDDVRVVLTDGSVFGAVSRGPDAFREKRLFPVDPETITRVVLDRPDGPLVVAREGETWRVVAPYDDAAAPGPCTGLARAVAGIEVVVPDAVAAPTNTLPARRLRLALTTTGEGPERVAFVAAAGIVGKRLAWRDGARFAGLVDESAVGELTQEASSFRDPRITSFSLPDVRRLTIERGGTSLRIERPGEAMPWTGSAGSDAFPVDPARVDDLLRRLRGLSSSEFESARPASAPTGTLSIDGETALLARIVWGPLGRSPDADGEEVWLTTPARPDVVFRVSAARFGPIPEAASDLAPSSHPEAKGGGRS
jgi:hypothetical protein